MITPNPRPGATCVALALVVASACRSEPTSVRVPPAVVELAPDTNVFTPSVAGAPLFTLVDEAAVVDAGVRANIAAVRARPSSAAVRIARLTPGADTLLAAGRAVAFDVNAKRRLVYAGETRVLNPTGSVSWFGSLQGGRFGQTNVVLTALGVTATLRVFPPDGAVYAIEPVGGGYHAITYVDQSKLSPID